MADTSTAVVSSSKTDTSNSSHTETRYSTSLTQETVVHELNDDGAGGLGALGTVNYGAKTANVRLVSLTKKTDGYKSDYEDAEAFTSDTSSGGTGGSSVAKGGEYTDNTVGEQVLAASTVTATYAKDFAIERVTSFGHKPPAITVDLCPYTTDYIVPGSVRFTWMGHVYEDYDGVLVRDRTVSDAGFVAGQVNYSAGTAEITDYVVSGPVDSFAVNSLWTVRQNWTTASIFMRTQAAPLRPSGFVMNLSDTQGNSITATADINGDITGTHLRGKIEYETGIVELQFGDFVLDSSLTAAQKLEWWYDADDVGAVEPLKIWRPWPVDPTTLRYNSVSYFYLPIDAEILGLDPVRLPQDGRVPIFRSGSYVVVSHVETRAAATAVVGVPIDLGRERISRVRVVGADGLPIATGFTVDLDAGIMEFTNVTGYSQPVTIKNSIEDLVRVSDVQIDGTLTFTRQLSHDFPVGSVVSSAIMTGSLFAHVSVFFDQASWVNDAWSDTVTGAGASASYNLGTYPFVLTNRGALPERWVIRFTSSNNFECIGEHVGNIGTGSKDVEYAPINPRTGQPYFTIPAAGWGAGWANGNILRFNTEAAMYPYAAIRTVQMGPPAGIDYNFELLNRGDVDRPPSAP